MIIRVCDDPNQMGYLVAKEVEAQLNTKKDSVLILPTGSTPLPVYENIVEMYKKGEISWS